MKVTVKTVSDRITILENQKTRSLNEDFQLAVYRWALELKRGAEAAEARLAELEKQKPIYQYMTVSMSDETWLQERWHDCTKEEFDDANSEFGPTRRVYRQQQPCIAHGLDPSTTELVITFAEALARKLLRSQEKYGWHDGWKDAGWQEKCLTDFHHHIGKGDPLDVAAYCAFMLHHGWKTRPADLADLVPDKLTADGVVSMHHCGVVEGWNDCCDAILRNIEVSKNGETTPTAKVDSLGKSEVRTQNQALDEKRVEFIQSLAEDPALLSGKSGLLKYKFDQHWFAVDGCRETVTHYVARLRENGVVTHYAKSLYDFREDGEQ